MFLSSQILVLKFEACLRAARGALRMLLARPKGITVLSWDWDRDRDW